MSGCLITLEGLDGSGKTTLAQALACKFSEEGVEVVYLREPGGCPLAEELRPFTKRPDVTETTRSLLFAAARSQLVEERILPALQQGKLVLCDRFVHSTLAYQKAFGVSQETINDCINLGTRRRTVWPNLTLWLDLEVMLAMARCQKKQGEEEEEEEEDSWAQNYKLMLKIRQNYLDLVREDAGRHIKVLQAMEAPQVVFEQAWQHVERFLPLRELA